MNLIQSIREQVSGSRKPVTLYRLPPSPVEPESVRWEENAEATEP